MKILSVVVLAVVCLLSRLTICRAEILATPAVSAKVSLETPSVICLGDPIIIRAKILSNSKQSVALLLGTALAASYPIGNQKTCQPTWYKMTLVDENADIIQENPDPTQPVAFQGYIGYSIQNLDPSGSIDQYVAVTDKFNIAKPGSYTLKVDVHLPYTQVSDYAVERSSLTTSKTSSVTDSFTFPIKITAKDSEKLRSTAQTICTELQMSTISPGLLSPYYEQALADALFAMPEAEAASSWLNLIRHNRGIVSMNQLLAEQRLVYLRTAKSADLLAYLAWDLPPSNANTAQLPQYYLEQMYNTSDELLRRHIRHLFVMHGISQVPDKFATYSPTN